jgi:photoactive yellow protein
MEATLQIDFNATDAALRLLALSDDELDALPFGVVEMDLECTVLRYNAAESGYSGLPRERVVGRHFFRDVAPCSNNRRVAQRYAQPALDETIAYTFALRMQPVPVTLRMLKPAGGQRMLLLVHWS